MTVTNNNRARWANEAIKAFRKATGTGAHDAAADLICDILHWCDSQNQYGLDEVKRGIAMYLDERDYPPDGWAPGDKLAKVHIKHWR